MATKPNSALTPEELAAKRSASAKKAAATRAANKAAKLAEAAPDSTVEAKADASPKKKAKASAKAKKSKPKTTKATGEQIGDALVAEHEDAASSATADLDEGPGDRIDHAAFASSDEEDYDEPAPDEDSDSLAAEAIAFVQNAIGGDKKKKSKKKDKAKAKAEKKADKPNKKARKRIAEEEEAEHARELEAKAAEAAGSESADEDYGVEAPTATKKKKAAAVNGTASNTAEAAGEDDDEGESRDKTVTFSSLGLIEPLQRAVADMGFETPTVIQARAIPLLIDGEDTDLVGLAQTGTGKTAAFGLPALNRLHVHTRVPQVLILAPTRELCLQITEEMKSFAKYMREVDVAPVYGGADIVRQIKQIRRGVQVVVATPGRLRDLIRRRAVDLQQVRYLVLDEADEMLNMGFKEEIDDILQSIPNEAHTWLFSATMPADVRRIAAEYMDQPKEVQSGERNSANADISHRFVVTRPRERFGVLRRFLDYDPDMYGLVFVRTRADAKDFADNLANEGYNVDALHGDLSQAQRDNVMGRFRSKRLQVLVATDVAARGIDVTGITHVFHLNLPDDLSFYTHRSGRTGRAGAEGISLALVHPKDTRKLRSIERMIKARFEEATIPTGEQIIARRLMSDMTHLRNIKVADGLDAYLPAIEESLEGLDREAIIKRVASRTFEKLFADYRFAPDLNNQRGRDSGKRDDRRGDRDDRDRGPRRERGNDENMERLFVNVGGMDVGGRKGNLLAMICDAAGISSREIGRITMNKTHTFFDVDKSVSKQTIDRIGELHFDGRPVRINPAEESDQYSSGGGGGGGDRDYNRGGRSGGGGGRRDYGRGGGRNRDRGGRNDDRRGGNRGGGGGRW